MTPHDIRRGQVWREKRGPKRVEVLRNDGREVGAWIELLSLDDGAVYQKRWHNLAKEYALVAEARAA